MHATALLPWSPVHGDTTPEIVALRAAYRRLAAVEAEGRDYRTAEWAAASAEIDVAWRALQAAMRPTTPCPIAAAAIAARDVEACRTLDLTRCTPEQVRASGGVVTADFCGYYRNYSTYCADDSICVRGTVVYYDNRGPGCGGIDPEVEGYAVAVDDAASFAWLFGLPVTHARAASLVLHGERAPGETRTLEDEALDGLESAAERAREEY